MYKNKHVFFLCFLFIQTLIVCQNIKTIQLKPTYGNTYTSIVKLGTSLELSFDDLDAEMLMVKNISIKLNI